MQQKEAGASRRVKMPEAKPPFFTRAPFIVTCATVLCLGLGAAFLYGPAQQLYTDIRERDRLAAEYEAVTERNAAIEASVDALSTEAGIEDEASEFRGNIVSEDITAPDTWYSDLLDPIFGVE